jgi:hypothetical protein
MSETLHKIKPIKKEKLDKESMRKVFQNRALECIP